MKPEKVIFKLLAMDPIVVSRVGVRVFPVVAPKGADLDSQYLVVKKISDVKQSTIAQNSNFVLRKARIQIDCKANEYELLKTLVADVVNACDLKNGVISGVQVVSCTQILEGAEGFDSGLQFFEQPIDFQIFYHDSGV